MVGVGGGSDVTGDVGVIGGSDRTGEEGVIGGSDRTGEVGVIGRSGSGEPGVAGVIGGRVGLRGYEVSV